MQIIWIRKPAQRQKMQRSMDQVSQSCDNYDLKISTKRQRLVVHQPALGNRTMNQLLQLMGEN